MLVDLLFKREQTTGKMGRVPSNLPLYILVGASDVLITAFGQLEPLVDRYRAVGLEPVVAIYPEGRHEILNEINRDEVVGDLLGWLNRAIETIPRSIDA